jgi:hypothetical protein
LIGAGAVPRSGVPWETVVSTAGRGALGVAVAKTDAGAGGLGDAAGIGAASTGIFLGVAAATGGVTAGATTAGTTTAGATTAGATTAGTTTGAGALGGFGWSAAIALRSSDSAVAVSALG